MGRQHAKFRGLSGHLAEQLDHLIEADAAPSLANAGYSDVKAALKRAGISKELSEKALGYCYSVDADGDSIGSPTLAANVVRADGAQYEVRVTQVSPPVEKRDSVELSGLTAEQRKLLAAIPEPTKRTRRSSTDNPQQGSRKQGGGKGRGGKQKTVTRKAKDRKPKGGQQASRRR